MHKVWGHYYSSCTSRSSENICSSSSGGAQENRGQNRMYITQFTTKKICAFLSFKHATRPWMANVLFCRSFFLWISPGFGPNSGFWCCVFSTVRLFCVYRPVVQMFWWHVFFLSWQPDDAHSHHQRKVPFINVLKGNIATLLLVWLLTTTSKSSSLSFSLFLKNFCIL
jgi:hypothetical protein